MDAETLAVLVYVPQLAGVVGLITWTLEVDSGGKAPREQLSVPFVMAQPATVGLRLQLMPVPAGNASLTVTDSAAPLPPLCTPIVNPICDPAVTLARSAVFVTERFGHRTVMVADACCEVAFAADNIAIFG